jgi:phospholipid/cholesterol/gamma-HCH transport system substrate-binding protein
VITDRTKRQLWIFLVITLLGCTYVGARYARLDRLFFEDSYTVVAHYQDSGGIFEGAAVSYRGVTIGRVGELKVTPEGVDVSLDIDKKWDKIPRETVASTMNRSALGEQYVDLQPMVDDGPYLLDESEIALQNTRIPIPPVELLSDISSTVNSVDRASLQSVVTELGMAFDNTGKDLAQIIDTSNAFIEAADDNFETTTALIRDSNTVLRGQLDTASAIRTFSKNLALFSTSLVGSDRDLRQLIDSGSTTAIELNSFLKENQADLATLLNNLRTVGELQVENLDGLEQLLVWYPLVVEQGFTVVGEDPVTHRFDAHFGLTTTMTPLCHKGYEAADRRSPQETGWRDMVTTVRCTESPTKTNSRGSAQAPRPPVYYDAFVQEPGVERWELLLLQPFAR